jgi:hypothetical protein
VGLLGRSAPGYRGRVQNVAHLLSVAALATGVGVDGTLESVRRAQHLLQPHAWSEVVRIENSAPDSRYPTVVNALIFQLDSVLWFYTPTDGTQSLSLYRGRAQADKSNLGPLLAAIDRGFTHWEVLPSAEGILPAKGRLPNGCFIESMAILFQRLESGARIENPKLLSYYAAPPAGIRGHTVLQFTSGGRVQIIDPDRPSRVIRIHFANENDPRAIADRIRADIARARHLPLGEFLDRILGRYYATVQEPPKDSHEHTLPSRAEPPRNTSS